MEDIINLFLNSSVSIAVIIFFMYRDLKFMSQLQTTLTTLIDTVNTLKDIINREGDDNK